MPTSTNVVRPEQATAGEEETPGNSVRYHHPVHQCASPARSESPMVPSPGQPPTTTTTTTTNTNTSTASGGNIPVVANFSVINYVGKIQKQSSYKSSTRCRTPYEKCGIRSATTTTTTAHRLLEPLMMDETTSSSIASSIEYGCSSSSNSSSTGIACETGPECSEHGDGIDTEEESSVSGPRLRSRRSISVSSSGCSSSMDDRNCDFSPLGSIISCRCNSYSMSDFDDDGFREDGSVSSGCAVFSTARSYQPHHPLHHHHQTVPHHANNHKGLFDIALKTVKLIRRNQELQLRLSQLQEETHAFIESVMANPENESLRSRFYATQSKRLTAPVAVQK